MKKEKVNFRDQLSTVTAEGKRAWIYAKKPSGRYYIARNIVGFALLAFLFGAPFVTIFGTIFHPQDVIIFGLAFLTGVLFVVLFTVAFGRLFCGWVCPQTVFMELIFRRIEYWIEGDYSKQKALDRMAWNSEKILKKSAKHLIFYAISFLIGNTFLSYLIGIEQLTEIVTANPAEHLGGLSAMFAFSTAFYLVFAFFREQVCTIACPYGRLQSVLVDGNTMAVAYDHKRGEPRGKLHKNEAERKLGDCIDCLQCVFVCPTGIDIRNGTQLECTNCTACIDACDEIMDKIEKPRGLIRYASENSIENKTKFKLTKRMIAYSVVLTVLFGVLSGLIFFNKDVKVTVLRTPGQLYTKTEGGKISNLYNMTAINKTTKEIPITLKLLSHKGEIRFVNDLILLKPQGMSEGTFFIEISPDQLKSVSNKIVIGIFNGEKLITEVKSNFLAP